MKRIYLIGYMGAGKTTVGRALEKLAGLSFIDLDHYIEGRYLKTIGQLFAERGEEAFREIERRVLHEVSMFEDVIISTGGGTPCFYDNMEFMKANGTTVYLKVSVDELAKRLELCKHTRPVLQGRTGDELKVFIARNLEDREVFYERADVLFDAETMLTGRDVRRIAEALHEWV